MNHLTLIGGVLLVFLLIGPAFPMPIMVVFMEGSVSALLESVMVYPLAVMVGSIYAIQSAMIFTFLIILFRWLRQRYSKLTGISLTWLTVGIGTFAGVILLIFYGKSTLSIYVSAALFFVPSVLCGLIYGRLFRQFLTQYLDNAEAEVPLSEAAS
jgi:hypothetical protein